MKLGGDISCFIMTCNISAPDTAADKRTFQALVIYSEKLINQPTVAPLAPIKSTCKLDQISTEEVIDVRTHIPLKALMIPLKRVRGVVYVNQCSNTIFVLQRSPQKMYLVYQHKLRRLSSNAFIL